MKVLWLFCPNWSKMSWTCVSVCGRRDAVAAQAASSFFSCHERKCIENGWASADAGATRCSNCGGLTVWGEIRILKPQRKTDVKLRSRREIFPLLLFPRSRLNGDMVGTRDIYAWLPRLLCGCQYNDKAKLQFQKSNFQMRQKFASEFFSLCPYFRFLPLACLESWYIHMQ